MFSTWWHYFALFYDRSKRSGFVIFTDQSCTCAAGNFREAEIFAIEHHLAKFFPAKISYSKNSLLTCWGRRAQCLWVAHPVNRHRVDQLYRRSIEQSAEILRDLRSTHLSSPQLQIDNRRWLPPFGKATFRRQRPTGFDKRGASYYRFDVKIHAEGHHFHAVNCRELGQMLWPCRENKIWNFFLPGVFFGDSRKFMLEKNSRYIYGT